MNEPNPYEAPGESRPEESSKSLRSLSDEVAVAVVVSALVGGCVGAYATVAEIQAGDVFTPVIAGAALFVPIGVAFVLVVRLVRDALRSLRRTLK